MTAISDVVKQAILEPIAERFSEAENGKELWNLSSNSSQTILSDWNMPEMDGLTFYKVNSISISL